MDHTITVQDLLERMDTNLNELIRLMAALKSKFEEASIKTQDNNTSPLNGPKLDKD